MGPPKQDLNLLISAQDFDQPAPSLRIESVHLFAVLRQVAGLREGLATGGAGVDAVAGMGAHVSRQVARLREGLAAGGAGVGAVAGMGAHVYRQAAGLREGLAAGGTGVDAVASMGAHVSRQVAGLREGLAAGGAGVGAVARMGAHVTRQVAGLREGLAAGGADVGADAGMGAQVLSQIARRRAGLAADGALQVEIAPRPAPFSLARRSRAPTRSFSRRLFLPPLACDHRQIKRRVWRPLRPPSGQNNTSTETEQSTRPCVKTVPGFSN